MFETLRGYKAMVGKSCNFNLEKMFIIGATFFNSRLFKKKEGEGGSRQGAFLLFILIFTFPLLIYFLKLSCLFIYFKHVFPFSFGVPPLFPPLSLNGFACNNIGFLGHGLKNVGILNPPKQCCSQLF
jgi:hypothetical protein